MSLCNLGGKFKAFIFHLGSFINTWASLLSQYVSFNLLKSTILPEILTGFLNVILEAFNEGSVLGSSDTFCAPLSKFWSSAREALIVFTWIVEDTFCVVPLVRKEDVGIPLILFVLKCVTLVLFAISMHQNQDRVISQLILGSVRLKIIGSVPVPLTERVCNLFK